MTAALILLFAAADPVPVEPVNYRLPVRETTPRIVGDCRRAPGEEIVVCGRRSERHRLEDLRPPEGVRTEEPGVIGYDSPIGRIEPDLQTVVRQDGLVDRRVMVKLKIPF